MVIKLVYGGVVWIVLCGVSLFEEIIFFLWYIKVNKLRKWGLIIFLFWWWVYFVKKNSVSIFCGI